MHNILAGLLHEMHKSFCTFCRYGWISEPLANGEPHTHFDNVNYDDLIPLETDGMKPCGNLQRPRIVIGHNVSYDRAKIKEQYWLQRTGMY